MQITDGRRALAIVASALAPGAGQLLLGRTLRGLLWLALLIASQLLFRWLGLWAALLMISLYLAQVVDAGVSAPLRLSSRRAAWLTLVGMFLLTRAEALAVRAYWIEAFKSSSGSMLPALEVGDHFFTDKRARHPERGDVIVFQHPTNPAQEWVKRVLAVGGDTIELRDGVPIINGVAIEHRQLDGDCSYRDFSEDENRWDSRRCVAFAETLGAHHYRVYQDGSSVNGFARKTVPPGSYFVVGDNRDNSSDSRFWGFVPGDLVKGRATSIWMSWGEHGPRWERFGMRVP